MQMSFLILKITFLDFISKCSLFYHQNRQWLIHLNILDKLKLMLREFDIGVNFLGYRY